MSVLTMIMLGFSASAVAGEPVPVPTAYQFAQVSEAARCLGANSDEMKTLVAAIDHLEKSDGQGARAIRNDALSGVSIRSSEVVQVSDEAVCESSLRILREHLGAEAVRGDGIAVIRVGGRYIARYRRYVPDRDIETVRTYYFDPEFKSIVATTW